MFRIGVDLGGTKIEAIALAADGSIAVRRRIATPRHDYRGTLDAIASLVREIERTIGEPGPPSASACPAPSRPPRASSRTRTRPG